MKRSALLTCCMCACLTTMMDSSSEFQHLAFAPGVTVEGQFLASLAPPRESVCTCRASSAHAASDKRSARQHTLGDASEEQWGATTQKLENVHERFWRVLLHDDDEHTLDYAMETVEGVLRREVAGRQGLVRRAKVQWVAYQAHHYGMGTVAVLPESAARRAVGDLQTAGLACSLTPE